MVALNFLSIGFSMISMMVFIPLVSPFLAWHSTDCKSPLTVLKSRFEVRVSLPSKTSVGLLKMLIAWVAEAMC